MCIRKRAVSGKQKAARRAAILEVAKVLVAERDYAAMSMADIAAAAGLAKGTLFLYFHTKEELFLELQADAYKAWFDGIDARLKELAGAQRGESAFVREVSESLSESPVLLRLLPLLHVVFEKNVDYEAALRFKRFLLERVTWTAGLVEQCLPALQPGGGLALLLQAQALIIGLQHLASPSPVVRRVIAENDMAVFEVDFAEQFALGLKALVLGLARLHSVTDNEQGAAHG